MIAERRREFARDELVLWVIIDRDQFFYGGKPPEMFSPFLQQERIIEKDTGVGNLLERRCVGLGSGGGICAGPCGKVEPDEGRIVGFIAEPPGLVRCFTVSPCCTERFDIFRAFCVPGHGRMIQVTGLLCPPGPGEGSGQVPAVVGPFPERVEPF